MREVYRKDFDPDSGDYYYTNVRTNEVRWDNPAEALSLIKAEDAAPELGPDSQLIVSKDSEIERLKKEVERASTALHPLDLSDQHHLQAHVEQVP